MKNKIKSVLFSVCILSLLGSSVQAQNQKKPNVILIYVDDLGYGDLSSYGATEINTPHLDALTSQGIRFTNGHATSATCTPSRYAIMTGEYPWRTGAAILPGDAALIIPTNKITLPSLFQQAGYKTGVVGKWHLGLGATLEKDWNKVIKPGPNEVGFDYSFIFPATADRVPTVFMENGLVLGLDENDPIEVNYTKKIGNEPTGKENPELLKLPATKDHGHENTIVNGIGRIGYMTGGKEARWTDEEVPLTFLLKAQEFIEKNQDDPFFLFYALTEPHVPRMPSTFFKGKSKFGFRGDAILQMDWAVGELRKQLEYLGISDNTIIIFSSDNGPVLDDGYQDYNEEGSRNHQAAGPLRGGKYSSFEGGTRVPFIVSWPDRIKPSVSNALVSQIDFLKSFSALLNQPIPANQGTDSEDVSKALFGETAIGRKVLVKQGRSLALSVTKDNWKYIEPNTGSAIAGLTGNETGNSPEDQLYNLESDPGEKNNLAKKYPKKVNELKKLLETIKNN